MTTTYSRRLTLPGLVYFTLPRCSRMYQELIGRCMIEFLRTLPRTAYGWLVWASYCTGREADGLQDPALEAVLTSLCGNLLLAALISSRGFIGTLSYSALLSVAGSPVSTVDSTTATSRHSRTRPTTGRAPARSYSGSRGAAAEKSDAYWSDSRRSGDSFHHCVVNSRVFSQVASTTKG